MLCYLTSPFFKILNNKVFTCLSTREDICKCGYSKTVHVDEAIKPEEFTGESWDIHRHVREVPSDAFGDINFGGLGQKTGKVKEFFINISNITLSICKHVPILTFTSVFVSTFVISMHECPQTPALRSCTSY